MQANTRGKKNAKSYSPMGANSEKVYSSESSKIFALFCQREMKRLALLFAIIASTAQPASAETWWLIISARNGGIGAGAISIDIEQLPMETEEQCEAAGKKIVNSKDLGAPSNIHHSEMIQNVRYLCVRGK